MKVLHIAETVKGGVGTIINSLLKIEGVDSLVISPNDQGNIINGTVVHFSRKGRTIASLMRLALKSINTIKKEKPNIIHLHSTFAGLIIRVLYAIKLLRKNDVTIVYTPHAFSFLRDTSSLNKNIYGAIEAYLSQHTDKIICTSIYEFNQGVKYGLDESKMQVIYNGVDLKKIKLEFDGVYDQEQHKKINILFLGRFDYQKGYDRLIYIIENLDENKFHFNIIGDAVHDQVTKIDKSNVSYHGWVEFCDLKNFFLNSDFMLMPSRWESFGLVAVESQCYGLPVLASKCSSLPEVVDDGNTGVLLDFSDLDNVVDYINRKNKDFWNNKKDSCKDFAYSKFSEDKMNSEYYSLYKDKLGKLI
ncbi:glycosyltransferase family 4 protein [Raoultella ornithinolytica]|uniref:glycosyltransferase family 4 protein n=1 Tax=Raoultella ornithinolytica TaxID=54291 RepID=UPI003A4D85C2